MKSPHFLILLIAKALQYDDPGKLKWIWVFQLQFFMVCELLNCNQNSENCLYHFRRTMEIVYHLQSQWAVRRQVLLQCLSSISRHLSHPLVLQQHLDKASTFQQCQPGIWGCFSGVENWRQAAKHCFYLVVNWCTELFLCSPKCLLCILSKGTTLPVTIVM